MMELIAIWVAATAIGLLIVSQDRRHAATRDWLASLHAETQRDYEP